MRVIQKALTFDDVLLLPAHSRVLPREVSLKTRLTRKLELNIPLVSAAMDTVTEARLAIAIAQEGGIGIVHKNLPPEAQAAEVAKVKRFESGVLRDPMTVTPEMTVRDVMALQKQHKISGFPVVKLFSPERPHAYDFLPIDEVVAWLDTMATKDPAVLLAYAKERADAGEWRDVAGRTPLEACPNPGSSSGPAHPSRPTSSRACSTRTASSRLSPRTCRARRAGTSRSPPVPPAQYRRPWRRHRGECPPRGVPRCR